VNIKAWAIAAIVFGLALMLGGPLVAMLTPGRVLWTDQDQQAYSQASVEFHDASYGGHDHSHGEGHGHGEGPAGSADEAALDRLQTAKAAFERQSSRLQRAQSARGWITFACRGAGVIVAAVGVALYLRSRGRPS
jgi:hypothetical protein